MNRFLFIIMVWLSSLSAFAQTEGYNPDNPPLPNFPEKDTTVYYQLTAATSPVGGSLNSTGGKYKVGTTVYLYAYNYNHHVFQYWMDDAGNQLSTSSTLNYVMPKRNATVTAVYKYQPENPSLPSFPEQGAPTYKVSLACKPAGAGSFNTSEVNQEENASVHLYAYTNTHFKFVRWEDAKGNLVSTAQSFYYTVPARNTQLYAIYQYDPSNPQPPGANAYDNFTGEVIVDNFNPGNLSSAIYEVTKHNTSNITKIIVAGKINSNDFSIANNYSTCSVVDLSRTTGLTRVPSYCYNGNKSLSRLLLPEGITQIEYWAFHEATALTELTCFSMVPPTLGNNVFTGVNKGLVVYVPASVVELYENADGWKTYVDDGTIVIMPIRSNVASLEVNLPDACKDGRYRNMMLELVNVKSGQKYKYVITDRLNYTFNTLVKETRYVATLKNLSGAVLAKTDTISMEGNNASVTFNLAQMKQLRTIKPRILAGSNVDVTSQCTFSWYDEEGTFLAQSPTLTGQVSDTKVKCAITLPQTLGMEYVWPADVVYDVVEGDNDLTVNLAALPKMKLKGKVIDRKLLQAIGGVTVTVSQTLNGKYSKSFAAKTDAKGEYSIEVFAAPSVLTYAYSDYVSYTCDLPSDLLSQPEATLAEVKLKPITGVTITTHYSYAGSVAETTQPNVVDYYSDYANVSYSIYNETAGKAITQFNVQYPNIVLLEEVNDNDSLTIVAKSKNESFMDVTTGGRVGTDGKMSVNVPVVQLGGIRATFTTTGNSSVLGILYDADGQLINKYAYNSAYLDIKDLKDGEYTLVTMGESEFFGSISNLAQFKQAGLENVEDYVANKVSVRSGIITPIKNTVVPYFDESKFYYTGSNTSFTVNKVSIVAGNYLTLTAKVDFKSVYKDYVKNVSLSVDLPEGTTFVDNSVMVGSSVAFYELNGRTLTIPLENNVASDRVRFCIIPTVSGKFAPNAMVAFNLKDKKVEQPIGSARYTVRDLSINVPDETNTPDIVVSGVAAGGADITLYADNEVVGTTRALANGYWSMETSLPSPYNLQEFDLFAKVVTKAGLEVQTDTKPCIYNKDKIVAKTVEMSFYNGWLRRNISLTFDLEKKRASENSYMFYNSTNFTFTANLSNNSPEKVKKVMIKVYTEGNRWYDLPATYNERIDRWVAVKRFETNNLPLGLKVNVLAAVNPVIDFNEVTDVISSFVKLQQTYAASSKAISDLLAQLKEQEESENPDWTHIALLNQQLAAIIGMNPEQDATLQPMSDEDFAKLAEQYAALQENPLMGIFDRLMETNMKDLKESAKYLTGFTCTSADGLSAAALVGDGYVALEKTNGKYSYLKASEKLFGFVDFDLNLAMTLDLTQIDPEVLEAMKPETNDSFEVLMNAYKAGLAKNIVKAKEAIAAFCKVTEDLYEAVGKVYQTTISTWDANEKEYTALNNVKAQGEWTAAYGERYTQVRSMRSYLVSRVNSLGNARNYLASAKVGKLLEASTSLFNIFKTYTGWLDDIDDYIKMYNSIPECPTSLEDEKMRETIKQFALKAVTYYSVTLASDIASIQSATQAMAAVPATKGASLSAVAVSLVKVGVNWIVSKVYDAQVTGLKMQVDEFLRTFKCAGVVPPPVNEDEPPYPIVNPIHDPSGYVYEAVSSNRLQGVTATCYYKEVVEDMYGDLHENIVLWNAEEYAQKNPLFTDENGMYQWDVPQGLWQVRFEKEGYTPTQSEWLPVPPPQMDVNIGMVQNTQPAVIGARAYEDGVEITFSKYMNLETLNAENVYLKVVKNNEETLIKDAVISMLDEEAAVEGSAVHYASKMKLATDKLGYYDEAYVIVSKNVSSYAGINMTEDFRQKLDVEKKVREILVDSVLNVAYGDSLQFAIAATPAEAAAGKKLAISSASEQIASINLAQVTFDAEGQAVVKVKGELLGATALNYTLLDNDMKATSMVNVVDPALLAEVKAPVASRVSGTAVYRGQTITLSTETEDATIYYTTDGTCPCESASRIKYERPIIINDGITIKAMAVGVTAAESETSEFTYQIRQSDVKLDLVEGWNWNAHDLSTSLPITEFSDVASRILTQTEEAVKDDNLGWTGQLKVVDAATTMKMDVQTAATKSFTGEQYNPTAAPVYLHKGWNWLGYPLSLSLSLEDAFSMMDVEEGDCIETLTGGFATYSEGAWTGELKMLEPGIGYLYKSVSDKSFVFNAVPTVANVKALYGHRLSLKSAPWAVNKHKYPNMMPVVASIHDEYGDVFGGSYYVAAISGDECRGVGKFENGILYLSVYGEANEAIRFVAVDMNTDELYDLKETVAFQADMLGTVKAPYALHFGSTTGINHVVGESGTVEGIYHINGMRVTTPLQPGVYVIKSVDKNGKATMKKRVVK